MKKLLALIIFLPVLAWANPRDTNPTNPDAVYQNDLDLRDMVNSRIQEVDGDICIDYPTFCVDVVNNFVGIGVSPSTKLHIVGSGSSVIRVSDGSNYTINIGYKGSGNTGLIATSGGTAELALGTNSTARFTIDETGAITQSYQPSFLAYPSATATNATGDGTNFKILYNTVVFDLGSDFNTGTNTFTAPVDGYHQLNVIIQVEELSTANHGGVEMYLVTSNQTYYRQQNDVPTSVNRDTYILPIFADMDANDTAHVTFKVDGSNKSVDIFGTSPLYTNFSGSLIN